MHPFRLIILTVALSLIGLSNREVRASTDMVDTIRFLSAGKRLVVGSRDVLARGISRQTAVFDAGSGKLLKRLPVSNALFAPDDSYYVVGGKPMRAYRPTGRLLRSFSGFGQISPVAFSPDGKILIGQGAGGYVGIWDAKSGQLISRSTYSTFGTNSVHFSPDPRFLYANSIKGPARFSIDESGHIQVVRPYPLPGLGIVGDFDIHWGRQLLCASIIKPVDVSGTPTSAQVILMNLAGRKLKQISVKLVLSQRDALRIRFSRDGRYAAIMTQDDLTVRSASQLKVLRRYKPRQLGLRVFSALDFSPATNLLAVGGWEKSAPVFIRLP